jgi:hypothetical protein
VIKLKPVENLKTMEEDEEAIYKQCACFDALLLIL